MFFFWVRNKIMLTLPSPTRDQAFVLILREGYSGGLSYRRVGVMAGRGKLGVIALGMVFVTVDSCFWIGAFVSQIPSFLDLEFDVV